MPHGAEEQGHLGGDGAVSGSNPAVAGESGLPATELAQAAAEAIGTVEATDGRVDVVRPDGTRLALTEGDPLFQGDTIETGPGAAIGVVFVDDTTFALGAEGQVVLDEMIYDPGTETGVFHANMVQGVFSFISGQGNDTMTGGAGNDTFQYTATNELADTITSFVSATDSFEFSRAAFSGDTDLNGALDAGGFQFGGGLTPSTGTAVFVFDSTGNDLYYDSDGLGGAASVLVADLDATVAATDITFVA